MFRTQAAIYIFLAIVLVAPVACQSDDAPEPPPPTAKSPEQAPPEATLRREAGGGGEELPGLPELPLTAAAVLAEKEMPLGDALGLRPGDVVAFPRRADDPLELRIGGRTVARGSAVLLGEHFGLRLSGGA